MAQDNPNIPPIPNLSNPRFTLELEFVLSLANPYYISHLAVTYPHLLGVSSSSSDAADDSATSAPTDARAFAAYLSYLYSYWQRPEYAQFLTHPGATLRALRLLQDESFRQAVIRPQVIEALLGAGAEENTTTAPGEAGTEAQNDTETKMNAPVGSEGRNGIAT
ncbi:suppressor of hpr1 [Onygenales sp. PD_40]|nr:suppressor of hpr1 [Onygenales sp. PD_40]KAK2786781.1 suppressor of hpr1 [Onygenales sp. PD_12]KAK2800166.1 suppressor of hpr1 [Onygenales sp. PD_10]